MPKKEVAQPRKKKKVCCPEAPHRDEDEEEKDDDEAKEDEVKENDDGDASEQKKRKRGKTKEAIKVPLPRELKAQLVLDWEQVTLEPRKWVPLPRHPTVQHVLDQFVASRENQHKKRWRELADSIVMYFDKALPKILLYRYEREQWALAAKKVDRPSNCYGTEHLLRLFAKLPELLVRSDLSPHEVGQVRSKLGDVFKFLVAHKNDFLLPHYQLREALLGNEDDLVSSSSFPLLQVGAKQQQGPQQRKQQDDDDGKRTSDAQNSE